MMDLNPDLVAFLNAVTHGEAVEPHRPAALQWLDEFWSWQEAESRACPDEQSQSDLADLAAALDLLDGMLSSTTLVETVATPLYRALELRKAVQTRAERGPDQEGCVNALLQWGQSYLKAPHGGAEGLAYRLRPVLEYLRRTLALYQRRYHQLPPDFHQGFEEAQTMLEEGLGLLAEAPPDPESIREGMEQIQSGAALISLLWEMELHLSDKSPRFRGLSSAGAAVEKSLMGRVDPTADLQGLQAEWGRRRHFHLLIVPLEAVEQVDEALLALMMASPPTLKDLDKLADAWAEMTQRSPRLPLWTDPVPQYFEVMQGLSAGTVPDVALMQLLRDHPLPADITQPLQDYLDGEGLEALRQAAAALLRWDGDTTGFDL